MIQFVTTPEVATFSRNQALFVLRATDSGGIPYGAVGASATLTAALTARFAVGQTLTVNITDDDALLTAVVFTSVAGIPSASNEIPGPSFVGTDAAYWSAVAAVLAAHPIVGSAAMVLPSSAAGNAITRVQARETSADWVITLANSAGFTVAASAPVADNTPANYTVRLQVLVQATHAGGAYHFAANLEGYPDTLGYIRFDVSSVLEAEMADARQAPLVPDFSLTTPYLVDNVRRYMVRMTEESGNPLTVLPWTNDLTRQVLDGGVSNMMWAQGNYLTSISTADSWLSWQPDGQVVGAGPVWLSWYNLVSETVNTRIVARAYDRTTGVAGAALTTHAISVDAYQSAAYPVSAAALGLNVATAYKYVVQLEYFDVDTSQWRAGSPIRTYYIDNQTVEEPRYLAWVNNFGTPEVLHCTGRSLRALNVERTVAERPLAAGYPVSATELTVYQTAPTPTLTYRTGYLRRSDAVALQELLAAREVYEITPDGYIPLLFTGDRFRVTGTREALHAYELEAIPRTPMRNVSIAPVSADQADAWQAPDGSDWLTAQLIPWQLP